MQELEGNKSEELFTLELCSKVDKHNHLILTNKLCVYDIEAKQKANDKKCQEWHKEIADWLPLSNDGSELKDQLLKEFKDKLVGWRQKFETYHYNEGVTNLVQELEIAARNLEDASSLHEALIKCRNYQKSAQQQKHAFINQAERTKAWESIQTAREKALNKLLENQAKQWDSTGKQKPELSQDDQNFLNQIIKDDDALSEKDYRHWWGKLDNRLAAVKVEWSENQELKCKQFLKSLDGARDATEMLIKFDSFYGDNMKNPHISSVEKFILSALKKDFTTLISEADALHSKKYSDLSYVSKWKKADNAYQSLRELCDRLNNTKNLYLQNSIWYKFAQKCIHEGKIHKGTYNSFTQTFTINRIEAKIDYAPQPEARLRKDGFPVSFKYVTLSIRGISEKWIEGNNKFDTCQDIIILPTYEINEKNNQKWLTLIGKGNNKTLYSNPWMKTYLHITATDHNKVTFDVARYSSPNLLRRDSNLLWSTNGKCIERTIEMETDRNTGDKNPKVHLRIYIDSAGEDLESLLNSVKEN